MLVGCGIGCSTQCHIFLCGIFRLSSLGCCTECKEEGRNSVA